MNRIFKGLKANLKRLFYITRRSMFSALRVLFCILITGIVVWQSVYFVYAKKKLKDSKQELRQTYLNSIFDVVNSTEAAHRVEAIRILSKIGDHSAIPHLKKLLKSKSDTIKIKATRTLAKLGNNTGIPIVFNILKTTPHISLNKKMKLFQRAKALAKQTLRVQAAEVIGETGNSSHIPLLKKIANDRNESRRLVDSCLVSLAKLGDKSKIRVFTFALLSKDKDARKQACYFLGELKEKSAVDKLTQLLTNWDKGVRAEACLALGKIGDKKLIPHVKKLLKDKKPIVRMKTCESLGLLGDKKLIPDIKKLLKDENGFVRLYASEALIRLGDFSGKDFLLKSLKSTDFDAKLKAIQTLSEFGKYNILPELEKIYSEETNELLKLNIAGALIRIVDRKKKQKEENKK